MALCVPKRDGRDKPGHHGRVSCQTLLPHRTIARRRAHLDAGAALDRLHHGGEVLVGAVLVTGELQHASHGLRDRHRHAQRLALGEAELHVLVHQADGEAKIERARQHHAAELVLGRGIASGAGVDHVEHDARIEPGLDAHHHRFRGRGHRRRRQEIVAELHGLPGTRALADQEGLADRRQQRLDRLHLAARSRHHQRERALGRAGGAAADGAVDLGDVLRLEQVEDALGHLSAGGREIDEAAHAFAGNDAVGAGRHREHDVGRRQACEDGLDFVGHRARRGGRCRPQRRQPRRGLGAGVEHDDAVTGLDQPARHVEAHLTEANKADVHAEPSRAKRFGTHCRGGKGCLLYTSRCV